MFQLASTTYGQFEETLNFVSEVRAGWPLHSLRARIHLYGDSWFPTGDSLNLVGVNPIEGTIWKPTLHKMYIGGVPASEFFASAPGTRRVCWTFPLKPRWPAFMANACLYAGALFAVRRLLAFVVGTRARRRRRLGFCVACGYDSRGLKRCPECGRAVEAGASQPIATMSP